MKSPHNRRKKLRVYQNRPSKGRILLSRIGAALLTIVCAALSILIIQVIVEGGINAINIIFALITLPSVLIAGFGVLHKDGLYYLRTYEDEQEEDSEQEDYTP